MFSIDDMLKKRIFIAGKNDSLKKYGKIRSFVFHPSQPRAIGVVIKRPDAALMVKRKDHFVALDRLEPVEGGLRVVDSSDSWDLAACRRLDVDFDQCIIWSGMPVRTKGGKELGVISDIALHDESFEIDHISISNGSVNHVVLGSLDIPAERIYGYSKGAIVVEDKMENLEESGGAAAKAGVAWAKTKQSASKAGKTAEKAINEGAYKAGEAIGAARDKAAESAAKREKKKREAADRGEYTGVDKAANIFGRQLGKASHMFKDFKDEFDKASHED